MDHIDARHHLEQLTTHMVAGAGRGHVDFARIALGIGDFAQVQDYYVDHAIAAGELVPVRAKFNPSPSPVSLFYPQTRHLSRKVRAFVNFMIAQFC
jgi:DNA-binding transcriptional LysR family regulator